MSLAPYENFRGFASSRPPLIVFMICLGFFAIVLMTLGYYVKISDQVRNPDVSQDWNVFLESFSELEFCILSNTTEPVTTAVPITRAVTQSQKSKETPSPSEESTSAVTPLDGAKNYSVSMLLTVRPTREFISVHHNLTHLSGSILGSEIGLKGPAAEEMINVTMDLPFDWNNSKCGLPMGCDPVQIYTCVHFQGNYNVFPKSRSPEVCESINETITGIEYHAQMKAHKPKVYSTYYCRSRPVIKANYKLNPGLTVWLTLHEKSAINLHMLHTSYFLMVMVITLFCYAVIRGKPLKSKITQTESQHALMSEAA